MIKRLFVIGILALVSASFAGDELAWELKVHGDTTLRYRYITRTGVNDIFGQMRENIYLGVNHLHNYPTPSASNRYNSAGRGVCAGENGWGAEADITEYRAAL